MPEEAGAPSRRRQRPWGGEDKEPGPRAAAEAKYLPLRLARRRSAAPSRSLPGGIRARLSNTTKHSRSERGGDCPAACEPPAQEEERRSSLGGKLGARAGRRRGRGAGLTLQAAARAHPACPGAAHRPSFLGRTPEPPPLLAGPQGGSGGRSEISCAPVQPCWRATRRPTPLSPALAQEDLHGGGGGGGRGGPEDLLGPRSAIPSPGEPSPAERAAVATGLSQRSLGAAPPPLSPVA